MKVPAVKRTKTDAGDALFSSPPSARCRYSSECISELCSAHLKTNFLIRSCTPEHALTHIDRARGRRIIVGNGGQAPIFVVPTLDSVGEFFPCAACCIIQVGADARADYADVEQQRLVLASREAAEKSPRLRGEVHSQG